MKVILIHGIGNNNPGWSAALEADKILGISQQDVVEFTYEDLMDDNWINRVLVWGTRIAASYYAGPAAALAANTAQDYVDDILTYFIGPGVRQSILSRLITVLEDNPNSIVIGFSLGSIVAYETLKNYPECAKDHTLITLGCPLGSPVLSALLRRFIKVPNHKRPEVQGWFNLYSPLDIISGRIDGLGCLQTDQFKVGAIHDMKPYLHHAKQLLPKIFP
jgi:pimeloyl-ACP methyl ester carboxylesterase